jgi:hypothetical protein
MSPAKRGVSKEETERVAILRDAAKTPLLRMTVTPVRLTG